MLMEFYARTIKKVLHGPVCPEEIKQISGIARLHGYLIHGSLSKVDLPSLGIHTIPFQSWSTTVTELYTRSNTLPAPVRDIILDLYAFEANLRDEQTLACVNTRVRKVVDNLRTMRKTFALHEGLRYERFALALVASYLESRPHVACESTHLEVDSSRDIDTSPRPSPRAARNPRRRWQAHTQVQLLVLVCVSAYGVLQRLRIKSGLIRRNSNT